MREGEDEGEAKGKGVCIGVGAGVGLGVGVGVGVEKVLKSVIGKCFAGIKNYINEYGYNDVLTEPLYIFNGDETRFLLSPTLGKVIAPQDYC